MRKLLFIVAGLFAFAFLGLPGCKDKVHPNIPISFQSTGAAVMEGAASVPVIIKLGSALSATKNITVTISGAASYGDNLDYTTSPAASGNQLSIVVPAGVTSFTAFSITVNKDLLGENDESIDFALGTIPDGLVAGTSTSVEFTISNLPTIEFQAEASSAMEGSGAIPITMKLGSALTTPKAITISFTGTASYGENLDYSITPAPDGNQLTIAVPAGVLSFTAFSLTPAKDILSEGDETVKFTLGIVPDGLIAGVVSNTTFTITNLPTIEFQLPTASAIEAAAPVPVTMKLGSALAAPKTIVLTLSGTATYGDNLDYTITPAPVGDQLTIAVPAGVTSFDAFTIKANKDLLNEADETVKFTLNQVPDGLIKGTGTEMVFTIVNQPSIGFSTSDFTLEEGSDHAIVITSSTIIPSAAVITVTVTPIGGLTLGAGNDATITPTPVDNTVTIHGNGSSSVSFSVAALTDLNTETGEGMTFEITSTTPDVAIGDNHTLTVMLKDYNMGLVAEYLFDGSANDTSGNGHHGTVTGATSTTDHHGTANKAYYFDGNDYVIVPSNSDVNFEQGQDFSISVWAAASAVQNDLNGTVNNILRKWAGDAQGYPFTVSYWNETHPSNPRKFACARYDGSACYHVPTVNSDVVNSDFHHLVFMKSGGNLKLYIDKLLVSNVTDITSCSTSNITDLYIGAQGGSVGNQRSFTGTIDDLRIFKKALSENEIAALFDL